MIHLIDIVKNENSNNDGLKKIFFEIFVVLKLNLIIFL